MTGCKVYLIDLNTHTRVSCFLQIKYSTKLNKNRKGFNGSKLLVLESGKVAKQDGIERNVTNVTTPSRHFLKDEVVRDRDADAVVKGPIRRTNSNGGFILSTGTIIFPLLIVFSAAA